MPLGPVQIVVVGFEEPEHGAAIARELERLREGDVIRLLDLLVLRKHDDGSVEHELFVDASEEAEGGGLLIRALMGDELDGESPAPRSEADSGDHETWYLDDAIPAGTAAAVAIIEHRWAVPLRSAVRDAGGVHLADAWLHPDDLVAIGAPASDKALVS